jgi:hypothetical protein
VRKGRGEGYQFMFMRMIAIIMMTVTIASLVAPSWRLLGVVSSGSLSWLMIVRFPGRARTPPRRQGFVSAKGRAQTRRTGGARGERGRRAGESARLGGASRADGAEPGAGGTGACAGAHQAGIPAAEGPRRSGTPAGLRSLASAIATTRASRAPSATVAGAAAWSGVGRAPIPVRRIEATRRSRVTAAARMAPV